MTFTLEELLVLFVIFLFLFVALVLFSYVTEKKVSNMLLGTFFLFQGLVVLDGYAFMKGIYTAYPSMAFWLNSLSWLLAPLLWLYTKSLIYDDFSLKRKDLVHTIPFLLMFFISFFTFHIWDVEYKAYYLEKSVDYKGWPIIIGYIAYFIQTFIYLFIAFMAVGNYHRDIKEQYSDIEQKRLSWLYLMLGGFSVIYVSSMVFNISRLLSEDERNIVPELVGLTSLLFVFVLLVLVRALRQSQVFSGLTLASSETQQIPKIESAEDGKLNEIARMLEDIMEKERIYLESGLSIQVLAKKLNVNARKLSQTINTNKGMSFFDYINMHRIEKAKEMIQYPKDPQQTISEVMYAVGFNSKSSFNTAFKKFADMTPSQFKANNIP